MAWPTDEIVTGELVSAAQFNRLEALLASDTLDATAAEIEIASIPAHWTNLRLTVRARCNDPNSSQTLRVRLNGSTASYDSHWITQQTTVVSGNSSADATYLTAGELPGDGAGTGLFSQADILIAGYAGTTRHKTMTGQAFANWGTAAGSAIQYLVAGDWRVTDAVTSITISPSAGSLVTGTEVALYGGGAI
ncbi:MAG: hypothetical protein NUW01_13755 [Gemmatimonadaceae bacterium]|nr:hypothetical protein [Gemmatimonadaceae bacterium]